MLVCAGRRFPEFSKSSVYGEQARKRLLPRLNLRSGVLPLFFVLLAVRRLFPSRKKKRLIAGYPRLFCALRLRPRVYITCTAFRAWLYILVFHACHLWPHSTWHFVGVPQSQSSLCSTILLPHYEPLLWAGNTIQVFVKLQLSLKDIWDISCFLLCREVRDVNYVHCQRIRGTIGVIVLNT